MQDISEDEAEQLRKYIVEMSNLPLDRFGEERWRPLTAKFQEYLNKYVETNFVQPDVIIQ